MSKLGLFRDWFSVALFCWLKIQLAHNSFFPNLTITATSSVSKPYSYFSPINSHSKLFISKSNSIPSYFVILKDFEHSLLHLGLKLFETSCSANPLCQHRSACKQLSFISLAECNWSEFSSACLTVAVLGQFWTWSEFNIFDKNCPVFRSSFSQTFIQRIKF